MPEQLLILKIKPACVNDLIELTGRRQANISQHLAKLRDAGLVKYSREGWNLRYSIKLPEARQVLEAANQYLASSRLEQRKPAERRSSQAGFWYGIPVSQINWQPTLNLARCVGCGICLLSCDQDVFAFDYAINKPIVVMPSNCMVGCMTCATLCPEDAIEFLSLRHIRKLIRQDEQLSMAKQQLDARRKELEYQPNQKKIARRLVVDTS